MERGKPNKGPTLVHELAFWHSGFRAVAGLDEAGRGALAGPVVAAAVILDPNEDHNFLIEAGVRDSKQLTPSKRQSLLPLIYERAQAWAIGMISANEIDRAGIVPATIRAMELALNQLTVRPDALLIDYLSLPQPGVPQEPIVHGDQISLSIASASIVAKVIRDQLLAAYDGDYPGYGFLRHKGYGTVEHRAALAALGPCALHRRSFQPLAEEWHT